MEADRGHLHHVLMFKLKLGHRRTVLILYFVTLMFALASILTYFNPVKGLAVIIIMILAADVFIEYTGMINPRWHPILSLVNRITGWPAMEDGEDPVDTMRKEAEETAEPEQKVEPKEETGEAVNEKQNV